MTIDSTRYRPPLEPYHYPDSVSASSRIEAVKGTPLHGLIENNYTAWALGYIENYENCDYLNNQNGRGKTPLHLAVYSKNIYVIKALLAQIHVDINIKDKDGKTPFHYAIESNIPEIIALFLNRHDLDVTTKDNDGNSYLHSAVLSKNVNLINYLLKHPFCNVNAKDKNGNTPLMLAIDILSTEIFVILLNHPSINIYLPNNNGKTPLTRVSTLEDSFFSRYLTLHQSRKSRTFVFPSVLITSDL